MSLSHPLQAAKPSKHAWNSGVAVASQQSKRVTAALTLRWLTVLLVVLVVSSTAVFFTSMTAEQLTTYQLHLTVAKETIGRGWQRNFHRLAGYHWDAKHASSLLTNTTRNHLQPLWNYTFTLPLPQLQRSLIYLGPNQRLRRVLHGLQQGTTTRVGVIGGSISHGAKASKIGVTDWFSLVGEFLRNSYPHAQVLLRNGCLPATPSALMDMCLEQSIDADVDLLFIEYVANDGANRFDETKAKVYERLLRKTLQQRHKPAVLLMQLMPKGAAFETGHTDKLQFFHTLEDSYGALAQYYDTPWLSWRNAMWRLAELHRYGYNWSDFMWEKDFMHPLDPGHKAIADVAIYFLQQTALQLAMNPYSITDIDLLQEPLPTPMFPGNYEGKNKLCVYGEAFKAVVTSADGWSFVDEGSPGKRKWGFISNKPGSLLTMMIDTRRGASSLPGMQPYRRMNVMIAYLRSYINMGQARVLCLSGCSCDSQDVDAHHNLRQSTIFLVRVLPTENAECEIGVRLLRNTTSGKHKFKVNGLMVNEYTGADITTKLHEEQWLHQMLTINAPAEQATVADSRLKQRHGASKQQQGHSAAQQQEQTEEAVAVTAAIHPSDH